MCERLQMKLVPVRLALIGSGWDGRCRSGFGGTPVTLMPGLCAVTRYLADRTARGSLQSFVGAGSTTSG
jgi:hypothetical protein